MDFQSQRFNLLQTSGPADLFHTRNDWLEDQKLHKEVSLMEKWVELHLLKEPIRGKTTES